MLNSYLTQIRMNLLLTLRNRMALFFSFIFPLIFFIASGMGGGGGNGQQILNIVLGLGVLGSGLFGVGMRAVQDREQNILRRFKVAPIGPGEILVSGLVTVLALQIPNIAFMSSLAHRILRRAMAAPAGLFAHLRFPGTAGVRVHRRHHRRVGELHAGRHAADPALLFPHAISERR